jgi:tetratricopeptide (TPR) repeat protein
MNMKRLAAGLIFVFMAAFLAACGPVKKTGTAVVDRPVQEFQLRLLDLAFSGVSEMPLNPHIKNRSRAQLNIVEACLKLGQPTLAAEYIEQIENWRRWMGSADLAFYLAENGYTQQALERIDAVQAVLNTAQDIRTGRIVAAAPNPLIDTLEDWRYRAVLSRIEEARLANGAIDSLDADIEKYGDVNASALIIRMLPNRPESFDDTLNTLRLMTQDPNFEVVHLGLIEMAQLVGRQYDRVSLPPFIAENVSPKLNKQMPVFLRLDVLRKFADAALENSDPSSALSVLLQVEELVEPLRSSPRIFIPEQAALVQLLHKAGETEQAEAGLQDMISIYQEKRALIVNIERAELLCRIAETAYVFGHREQAIDFYTLAVAEGQVNPNSRPQAEDLGRICSSIALHGVEPTEALWSALNEMKNSLGAPW